MSCHTCRHTRTHKHAGRQWLDVGADFCCSPCSIRGLRRSSSWQSLRGRGEKEGERGKGWCRHGPFRFFHLENFARVRVLQLRLFGSSLLAPAAVVCESFVNKGVFGSVILFAHADPCARIRSRSLAQERRGSSCCVTGSSEFGSLSGGKASVPWVKHPLNTTEIELRPDLSRGFKSYIMFMFSQGKVVRVAAVWMLRSGNSARDSWLRVVK